MDIWVESKLIDYIEGVLIVGEVIGYWMDIVFWILFSVVDDIEFEWI